MHRVIQNLKKKLIKTICNEQNHVLFQVSFYKPEILNQVAALEIKKWKQLYFKVRSAFFYAFSFIKLYYLHTFVRDVKTCPAIQIKIFCVAFPPNFNILFQFENFVLVNSNS